jgi:hypothetical protein
MEIVGSSFRLPIASRSIASGFELLETQIEEVLFKSAIL